MHHLSPWLLLVALVGLALAGGCGDDDDTEQGGGADSDGDVDTDSCEPHYEDGDCVVDAIECLCVSMGASWCEEHKHQTMLESIGIGFPEESACMYWCLDGHSFCHTSGTDEPAMDYHFDETTGDLIGYRHSTDGAYLCDGEESSEMHYGFTACDEECLIAQTDDAFCLEDVASCEPDAGPDAAPDGGK